MTSRTSRASARERAAQLYREQAERSRRRRVLLVSSGVVAAVLVVVALVVAVGQSRGGPSAAVVPDGLVDGAIVSGEVDAPVTVTLYEDFQCPACRTFEQAVGPAIDQLRDAGAIRVEQRPLAFLDRASADRYSSRALNAVACVLDTSPEATEPFIDLLFAEQPAEGGAGLSDARLARLAGDAGAAGVARCIADGTFADWVQATTQRVLAGGVTSTPTVLVDGQVLQDRSAEGLRAAVRAAAP